MVLGMAFRQSPGGALAALTLMIKGKRVRGWNLISRAASAHPLYYHNWIKHAEPRARADAIDVSVIPCGGSGLASVADLQAALLDLRPGAWCVLMTDGADISPQLGAFLGAASTAEPDADCFFWDEDVRDATGRHSPWFKPAWDPLLQQARDQLTGASCQRVSRLLEVLDDPQELTPNDVAGLIARASIHHNPVHIPQILTHRSTRQKPFTTARPPDPADWPSVSIMIPTRDRPELLRACLAGLERLRYAGKVELLIADNDTVDPAALALIEQVCADGKGRHLLMPGPFNFPRINNLAAAEASGDFLCLLNNDVEAMDGEWLGAMVLHGLQDQVGAVGAQLRYPDGTIQHVGVAIGIGGAAGHIQKGIDPGSNAHASWHAVTRQVSAVTAACLLVRKSLYQSVGGMDADKFAVAFNDIDFCLKLQAAGYRNIYVADACLIHHESQSRGEDDTPEQAERFQAELAELRSRWQTESVTDPHYHPLFSRYAEQSYPAF